MNNLQSEVYEQEERGNKRQDPWARPPRQRNALTGWAISVGNQAKSELWVAHFPIWSQAVSYWMAKHQQRKYFMCIFLIIADFNSKFGRRPHYIKIEIEACVFPHGQSSSVDTTHNKSLFMHFPVSPRAGLCCWRASISSASLFPSKPSKANGNNLIL